MKALAACIAVSLACALTCTTGRAAEVQITDFSGADYALHVTSLKEARFKRTIKQQFDFSCGSGAVAALPAYQDRAPAHGQTAFPTMVQAGPTGKIRPAGVSL